jgi:hypothetical protein
MISFAGGSGSFCCRFMGYMICGMMEWVNKRLGKTTGIFHPAAPPASAGGRCSCAALAAPPARRGCLRKRRATRRGAAERGLDRAEDTQLTRRLILTGTQIALPAWERMRKVASDLMTEKIPGCAVGTAVFAYYPPLAFGEIRSPASRMGGALVGCCESLCFLVHGGSSS